MDTNRTIHFDKSDLDEVGFFPGTISLCKPGIASSYGSACLAETGSIQVELRAVRTVS